MHYEPRPGVYMAEICGVYLLIPTREASAYCPGPSRLSLLGIAMWNLLSQGKPLDKLYRAWLILHKSDDEAAARQAVDAMLEKFCDAGFIILVEDEQ